MDHTISTDMHIELKLVSPNTGKRRFLCRLVSSIVAAVRQDGAGELDVGQENRPGPTVETRRDTPTAIVEESRDRLSAARSEEQITCNQVSVYVPADWYALDDAGSRWALGIHTANDTIWFPLHVPPVHTTRMAKVRGTARIFRRDTEWYVDLVATVKASSNETLCRRLHDACSADDPIDWIGIDLGVVRLATVAAPEHVRFFDGKDARLRQKHYDKLCAAYERAGRHDRARAVRQKEQRWMRDRNHTISRRIVDLACDYPMPALVLEDLDAHAASWFRDAWRFDQLVDFLDYKARQAGVPVVLCDPQDTSITCPACGHISARNRPDPKTFTCVRCEYEANPDLVAARNIAAAGPTALRQGRPDTAR